ncbi:MAG TPA: hypothetical protein IAC39_07075 [Candidatus Faeciplasma pullistercoris]|uniref:SH3 domain-containing protein n=1 Tax=Candidatus Faeciplasma pullistercoris TaxID=2840800 RepID=A0A9D1KLZ8_9FIRM|nr:hypothetical protein [Candidatus Faeciplasma pullistercoris]
MEVIWFIPLGFILLLIFLSLGLAREAIRGLLETLPIWIAAIVIIAVLFAIYRMVTIFKEKRPKCRATFTLGLWIMILSSTFGVFAFAGPTWLDRCGRWFTWFGDEIEIQMLTYVCAVILLGAAAMIIAFLIPSNLVSNIILLIPIMLPFAIYFNAMSVSTQSYSDFVTTDFTSEDTLTEYEVVRDTKIYYPTIWKGSPSLPEFSPIKYAPKQFNAGETVYAVYGSGSIKTFEEGSYVIVSNGTIGGKVLVDDLKDVAEPQYRYEIILSTEQAEVYEAVKVLSNLEIYEKGDAIVGTLTKDVVPGGILNVVGGDDGYLKIKLEDGSLGYISCNDVAVVRTPLAK